MNNFTVHHPAKEARWETLQMDSFIVVPGHPFYEQRRWAFANDT